jgi:hypothetical protein
VIGLKASLTDIDDALKECHDYVLEKGIPFIDY